MAPVLYGRQLPDFHVKVADTRVYRNEWYLYCVLKKPMIGGKSGRPIPCTLVFADSEGELHELNYTLVYGGDADEAVPQIDITWTENRGLLLKGTDAHFYKNETYRATITWFVSEVIL